MKLFPALSFSPFNLCEHSCVQVVVTRSRQLCSLSWLSSCLKWISCFCLLSLVTLSANRSANGFSDNQNCTTCWDAWMCQKGPRRRSCFSTTPDIWYLTFISNSWRLCCFVLFLFMPKDMQSRKLWGKLLSLIFQPQELKSSLRVTNSLAGHCDRGQISFVGKSVCVCFVLFQVADDYIGLDVLSSQMDVKTSNFRGIQGLPIYGMAQPSREVWMAYFHLPLPHLDTGCVILKLTTLSRPSPKSKQTCCCLYQPCSPQRWCVCFVLGPVVCGWPPVEW